jgi:sec-independent protein translocase protein TatA
MPEEQMGACKGVLWRRNIPAGGGSMFGLGELVVVLLIVVLLFSRRLPDLGESLGMSIKKFRKAMREPDEIDITPKDEGEKQ